MLDTKQSVDKEKQSAQRADKDKAENKSNENAAKPEDKEKKAERDKKAQEKKEKKKEKVAKREKMKENDILKSDNYTWRILKLLGSGGFGDVYKVVKEKDNDKQEYAMKTEMCEGDKRMLRLKIEVRVLGLCCNVENPEKRKHFLELVDRGKTEKFKFLVMGLVGKSLEDLRKNVVGRNYSKSTGMQCAYQTLVAIGDLHDVGYLHRDIKPQNFAVGLGEQEKTIYMLDFGIARKFTVGNTKQVKVPRLQVKFLGTLRFASRACHNGIEQGRKDDLETWIYMVFDLLDDECGLPWKRLPDRGQVVVYKEKFFRFQFPNTYRIVPSEFKRLVEYVNGMSFAEEPDYIYMTHSIKSIAKENRIDMERKLDWIGRTGKEASDDDETSSDNKNTGSEDSDDSDKNTTKRGHKKTATRKSDTRKKNTSMGRKKTGVSV
ncbi:hypothetical protein Q1695_009131 [Nippostrongylus brasiliensis]|nr:hypothetical protein Q1695_009131 [Nippostrongylus brasiliensis]